MAATRPAPARVPGDPPPGEVPLRLAPGLGPPAPPPHAAGRRSRLRARVGPAAAVAGIAAAGAGVVLALTRPPTPVYLDAAGYHIGDTTLRPGPSGLYANGAVVVLSPGTGGAIDAAASLDVDGVRVTGRCHSTGSAEDCRFDRGSGGPVACHDALTTDGGAVAWQRSCDDGTRVRIPVPRGSPVPVPIPLGR